MAKTSNFPIAPDADLNAIVQFACQNLTSQGYACSSQIMSENAATITVAKDRNDFKNHLGMGVECRISLSIMGGNQLVANIEDEWTNKIIACVVGFCCCWVALVTGVIGCVNQSGLADKVTTAIQMAIASAQSGAPVPTSFPGQVPNPYNQFPTN